MNDGWMLWLLLVGLGIGFVTAGVLLVRLQRDEEDIGEAERRHEAAWISHTIERYGGVAPSSLVEEVLELHQAYLRDPRAPEDPYVGQDATGPASMSPAQLAGLPSPQPAAPPPTDPRSVPAQPAQQPSVGQPPAYPRLPPQQAAAGQPPPPAAPGRSATPR